MSFPRYQAYKDSAVDWLGEVPREWTVCALAYRYEVQLGKMLDEKRITGERLAPYLRNVDVQWGCINVVDLPEMDFHDDDVVRFSLKADDLLVCEGGEVGRAAIWSGELAACFYQKALHRLRPVHTQTDSTRFAFYLMFAAVKLRVFSGSEAKATIVHLPAEALRRYRFAFPSLSEQIAIAGFLDRETAKIDALVDEQQRLIALLKAKRQAVISHAVTKGLDPNAPMKDSGVEWLDEVPAHWDVRPLGRICKYISYGFTNPMPVADDGPIMLTANDVDYGSVRYSSARRTTQEAFSELLTDKSRPVAGDLLLTKDGTLGRVAIHDGTPACINQSVAVLRPDTTVISSRFFCLALLGGLYQERMIYEAGGTTIKHIYISRLAKMPMAVPPLPEQDGIGDQLERTCDEYARLINAAEVAVTLLQERRSALISAAVTGKIDVRNLAPASAEAA